MQNTHENPSHLAARCGDYAPLILSLALLAVPPLAHADMPPPPQGVSVINADDDNALRTGILSNPNVDMISLQDEWDNIQPDEETYDWDHFNSSLKTVATSIPGHVALWRIPTMGGAVAQGNDGNTPDWVFTDMGILDPNSTMAVAGVTYSWTDANGATRCIPVFWQPVYLAKKKRLIAMAGANLATPANQPYAAALKVFVVSFANAITEDWSVPDAENGDPSEVELWLNQPTDNPSGAGYTTQLMIDAAIHEGDATFSDGVFVGNNLTFNSANFTQADIGCVIRVGSGASLKNPPHIASWLSPTQVTLDQAMAASTDRNFTLVARRDGLVDVAMAAFPKQYISMAVGGDGGLLDADAAKIAGDDHADTFLARTVGAMIVAKYGSRYITQRNSVSTVSPVESAAADTTWDTLADAALARNYTAGQALGVCWNNTSYRMNGGDNCDETNPNCPDLPPCTDGCIISYQTELQLSADNLFTYSAADGSNHPVYYEIYQPDALMQSPDLIAAIHCQFNPDSCSPKPGMIARRRH